MNDFAEAKKWYLKSLEIRQEFARSGEKKALQSLSFRYGSLGILCKAEGSLDEALQWFTKEMEIDASLAQPGSDAERRDLTISYNQLGDVCKALGDWDSARAWYTKSLEIREELAQCGTEKAQREAQYVRNLLASVTTQGAAEQHAPQNSDNEDHTPPRKPRFFRLNALFHKDD